MSDLAHYYFIPTVREGLAAWITTQASNSRTQVETRLTPFADGTSPANATISTTIPMSVGLYGPGDVLGFDPSVVIRTDPRPNVGDYEPNFMPLVEFHEPDFPWRFIP